MKRVTKEIKLKNNWTIGVHVFETAKEMRRFLVKCPHVEAKEFKDTWGVYQPYSHHIHINGMMIPVSLIGELFFCKEKFSTEILTHECTHAAIDVARKWDKHPKLFTEEIDRDEEDFCYLLGEITQAVWSEIQDTIE